MRHRVCWKVVLHLLEQLEEACWDLVVAAWDNWGYIPEVHVHVHKAENKAEDRHIPDSDDRGNCYCNQDACIPDEDRGTADRAAAYPVGSERESLDSLPGAEVDHSCDVASNRLETTCDRFERFRDAGAMKILLVGFCEAMVVSFR